MPRYAPNYKSHTTPPIAKQNTIHYPLTHSPLCLTTLPNHLTIHLPIHLPIHPTISRPPPTCTRTRGNENLWSTSSCARTRGKGKSINEFLPKYLPQTYPKLCNKSCPNFTQKLTKYLARILPQTLPKSAQVSAEISARILPNILPKYLPIFMEILPWFYCMLHAANRSFHDHKGAMNCMVN